MKFLIINTVYRTGSTGAIAEGLYHYFTSQGHEAKVCYGRGKEYEDGNLMLLQGKWGLYFHVAMTRITGLQGYFSNAATTKCINMIRSYKPDAVVLLNIHGYYLNEKRLLCFLKRENIRTVYVMPDEYPFLGKCCFSNSCEKFEDECKQCGYIREYPKSLFLDQSERIFRRKKAIYEGYHNIVFMGPEISIEKAKKSALLQGKELIVTDWGIDLEDKYKIPDTKGIKEKYHIPIDKKMILAVAKYSDVRKGIKEYFLRCAKEIGEKDIVFVNVGFDGDRAECPENYIPISYIQDQKELAALYGCADAFVIASRSDTMPLAAIISLACGTPICCFRCSGLAYLADDTCAYYVEDGNFEQLMETVRRIPRKTKEMSQICRSYAEKRYSDTLFYRKVLEYAIEKKEF